MVSVASCPIFKLRTMPIDIFETIRPGDALWCPSPSEPIRRRSGKHPD
ncbi:MAG: hypothetical protein MZV70_07345 [Desulfobacterales bacterium]|nr:hypothetical protein [Desulfobacterales bacterium]